MKNLRTKFAAVVIAAAAIVAAPAAASAAYPDATFVSGPATLVPGQPATFVFSGFEPGEPVTFTLTGENAAGATLATVRAAAADVKTLVKNAAADGTASVTVTLPSNASGTYTLTADAASTDPASTTFSVAAAGGLPPTGIDAASMTSVWIGGGALLAAGIAVTSVAMIRRRQAQES